MPGHSHFGTILVCEENQILKRDDYKVMTMMIDHDVDGSGLDLFLHTWTAKEVQNVVIMLVKICLR